MPNIIAQRVDGDGIYLKASDGAEVTVTAADLRTHYLTETGTAAGGTASAP